MTVAVLLQLIQIIVFPFLIVIVAVLFRRPIIQLIDRSNKVSTKLGPAEISLSSEIASLQRSEKNLNMLRLQNQN